ncbi:MAG: SDR family NAD(P)-dependent oxidoreductase [Clostridia bacterium]|nr:SDR family NAD(P)-dependent oxidoreductase [Clostridia bacterium]
MKTVLVTGGAGFIGSHLCERLLASGHKVINIDNFNDFYDPAVKKANIINALKDPQYVLFQGDIRDERILEHVFACYGVDIVVHLAALAGVRRSLSNPLEYIDIDIKGTVNLLEFCRNYGVEKFVFASSSSVYGSNPVPFSEDQNTCSQVSPYAASKAAGELFCKTYNTLFGIPVVCLRFFTVYGPRQRPEMAIHNFTRLIHEGLEIPVYDNGTSYRDYTYIDDILNGILAAMELKCSFEIFNLGNSSPVKLNTLIELIEEQLSKPAKRKNLPLQKGDVEYTCADISKAYRLLGYKPEVPIEEGIFRFVQWYSKNKYKTEALNVN